MANLMDINVANYMKVMMDTTELESIEGFSGLSEETSIIEVKQFNLKQSRKLVGSGSVAAVTLTCSYVPGGLDYIALEEARSTEARNSFVITLYDNAAKLNGAVHTFTGIVTSKALSSEYDTQRTVTWTIAVDGAVVETELAGGPV